MPRVPQVVIVDPDRESAAELQKMLQTIGFQVAASAGYGVEALSLALQLRPDLVLMRVEEPLVRPVQTLSKLNDGMPDLPIIVFNLMEKGNIKRVVSGEPIGTLVSGGKR